MTRRVLLSLALIVATGGILLGVLGSGLEGGDRLWPIAWVLWAPVGYLILVRRPGNGVGSAALIIGLAWGVGFALLTVSATLPAGPVAAWAELGNILLGVLPWIAIVWLVLVYPSGGYAGRAERITGRLLIGFGLIASIAFASGHNTYGRDRAAQPSCGSSITGHCVRPHGGSIVSRGNGLCLVRHHSGRGQVAPQCRGRATSISMAADGRVGVLDHHDYRPARARRQSRRHVLDLGRICHPGSNRCRHTSLPPL